MKRGTMLLMMQRNRKSDFGYPENREHYGVRYHMEPYGYYREPRYYYDERIHGGEPEMRRYSNGRFAPKNGMEYPEYDEYPTMRQIGFRDGDTSYVGDKPRERSERALGYASSTNAGHMTKELADEWVNNMKNADGTTGGHWTFEQCKQVMQQRGLDCDPVAFWVAMNAEYSDRCKVNEKHGIHDIDFYVDSACAFWMNDKDAVNNKETAYYRYVVRH